MAPLPPGERRTYTSNDGARLTFSYTRGAPGVSAAAGAPLVVLLHGALRRRHERRRTRRLTRFCRRCAGWSGSRRYWDTVVPRLAARGLSVLAPDLRWHGDSAAGSPPGGCSHVARLGTDLVELLCGASGACPEAVVANPLVLVGASMGAAVAW